MIENDFIFGEIISSNMLLYNARIFGYDDAEYLLIRNNIIEKIGKGALPSASRKIDLKGSMVLPGFCDSHTHLSNVALMHSELNLLNKTRSEILALVKKECKNRDIVIGRGWDESFWNRKEYITAEELDDVCSNKVVFLIREDGHMGVLNSYGIKKFGLDNKKGIVKEKVLEKIIKTLNIGKSLDFEYAQNYALSKGVTCIHDFANINTFREYMKLHREGKLKIRIYASFYRSAYNYVKKMGFYSGYGDAFLKVGALKLFLDGSIGAKTAATVYRDRTKVKPTYTYRKLRNMVNNANKNGIRVFTHAIGDLAIREVVKAYKETYINRIEHFELVDREYLEDMDGISVSAQPNFLKWAKRGGLYEKMLGEEWLYKNNPYRLIIDSGIELLFGSDCMPMDPIFGIKMTVGSEYSFQRVSIEEAVKAYTRGSKYFGERYGEIKHGNIADLVVVDRDILNEEIENAKVLMTIINGKIMYTSQ